jgi:transposase InsO family protein
MTDSGTEYVNKQMSSYLLEQGVRHLQTAPYSPQQNGQAERRNQTIMAMARCGLIESGISEDKWPFAVPYSTYTLNRLPTKSIGWKTPYELWTERKPNVQDLRPFGCQAFVHIDKSNRTSLQPTSYQGTFLGYSSNQKAWLIERSSDGRVFPSSNVVFNESKFLPVQEAQQQVDK